jgi:hypothetical protein
MMKKRVKVLPPQWDLPVVPAVMYRSFLLRHYAAGS